ncbi:hypothetical protein [Capsulimonas corticalis]|uniref:hypothetical protein n=1 Tax=Capsulimonas corticalis TaxID=2219043 RepID=UPI000FFA8280|nr:hypothetical protein [Capsulimonas corticalis]
MSNWGKYIAGLSVLTVLGLAGCGHQAGASGGSDEAESPAAAQQRAAAAQQAAAAQASARQSAPQPGQAQPK